MKRSFAALLAAGMLMALCACGASAEEKQAIELYQKYAEVIDRLEAQDYTGAMQVVAGLSNAGKEEPSTPIGQLFTGEWYLASGTEKLDPPEKITLSTDGNIVLDGETLTWVERSSSETGMSGYLLKDGVHTYCLDLTKSRDSVVPYVQLWTAKVDGSNVYSGDWVGGYYADAMQGYLIRSWSNLDEKDEVMTRSFSVGRGTVSINGDEYGWTLTSSEAGKIVIDVESTYTVTVELRGEKPIAFLTDTAAGTTSAYYNGTLGYDLSWPEYIYPSAMSYLNNCLEDVAKGYTVSFTSYLEEESKRYSGNAAWKQLYEIFAQLGDYKDSAEYAGRFTILKDMYTGATENRVDNMGNQSSSTYTAYQYNALGQMTLGCGADIFRMYGESSNSNMYFFYDEAGRITKVQRGTGNSVSSVVTLTYNDQGQLVGGTYQNNTYNHELSYEYDDQGRLVKNTVWSGQNRYQYTYTYDDQGRLVEQVDWHGWTEPDYKNYRYTTRFTYDDQGNLTQEVTVKEGYNSYNNKFTDNGTTTITYTNDAQGRPVSASIAVEGGSSTTYASQTVEYTYEDLYYYN